MKRDRLSDPMWNLPGFKRWPGPCGGHKVNHDVYEWKIWPSAGQQSHRSQKQGMFSVSKTFPNWECPAITFDWMWSCRECGFLAPSWQNEATICNCKSASLPLCWFCCIVCAIGFNPHTSFTKFQSNWGEAALQKGGYTNNTVLEAVINSLQFSTTLLVSTSFVCQWHTQF